VKRLVRTPSFLSVHRHYRAAVAKIGRRGVDGYDIVSLQARLRKISAEFHRRLKRAGIPVEGAK